MSENIYHKSVLVHEVLEYLAPKPNGVYIDATFGGGGHTRAILQACKTCTVIGVDWDQKALELNGPTIAQEFGNRFIPVWGNFDNLKPLMRKINIALADGVLADFGTSQYQIMQKEGFSFSHNTPLDMRMSQPHHQHTAADYVNKLSAQELADLFYTYGQEHHSRKIAQAIDKARQKKPIRTTKELADIVTSVIPHRPWQKIHPATKVFQALRIVVNNELNNIESFLQNSIALLKPGGTLVCISFHSLEDRIVKQFLKQHKTEYKILTSKVVIATDQEIAQNPSARSAKLRAGKRL